LAIFVYIYIACDVSLAFLPFRRLTFLAFFSCVGIRIKRRCDLVSAFLVASYNVAELLELLVGLYISTAAVREGSNKLS